MSLPECTVNTNNIQNLPDSPTLTADELKQEFDKSGKDIKDYINDILLPAIEKLVKDEKSNLETSINNKILADNKKKYPIGKIIMSTTNTNPNTYLGFGTWTLWGAGRVPVGVDTSDGNFNTVEKIGGSNTHRHNNGVTGGPSTNTTGSTALSLAHMPAHRHYTVVSAQGKSTLTQNNSAGLYALRPETDLPYSIRGVLEEPTVSRSSSTGSGQGHTHTLNNHTHSIVDGSNIQKYITCYMFKRTS